VRRGIEALGSMPPAITVKQRRFARGRRMQSPFVAAAGCEAYPVPALLRYLKDTREPDGSWMFEPHERTWPPDADSTSCALAALARAGEDVDASILRRIVAEQPDERGLIRPWLLAYPAAQERLDQNVGDAIVSANVLFAARRIGVEREALARALTAHVRANGVENVATVYYASPQLRAYYLARAGVEVAFMPPERERLLARQRRDGSWPADPWFTDPAGYIWSSRMFSTAFAVEMLTR
jgi:hypothetical protein